MCILSTLPSCHFSLPKQQDVLYAVPQASGQPEDEYTLGVPNPAQSATYDLCSSSPGSQANYATASVYVPAEVSSESPIYELGTSLSGDGPEYATASCSAGCSGTLDTDCTSVVQYDTAATGRVPEETVYSVASSAGEYASPTYALASSAPVPTYSFASEGVELDEFGFRGADEEADA